MTPGPSFSLLLPVYHGDNDQYFLRALHSATLEQVMAPDEVVIVQDGPVGPALAAAIAGVADGIVAGDAGPLATKVRVVRLDHNVGLARALETGLDACSHEIVARTDADDICAPHRFARQIPLLASGFDIVGSAIREFADDAELASAGSGGGGGVVRVPPLGPDDITRRARFHSPFNHPSVVYRKSAVRAAGGYQDLPLMEDYWLFARMLAGGARGCNIAEPLLYYRVGAGAYARRGGTRLLRSEWELQRRMRRIGFITWTQWARNTVVRGGYRLIPESLRRRLYRTFVVRGR